MKRLLVILGLLLLVASSSAVTTEYAYGTASDSVHWTGTVGNLFIPWNTGLIGLNPPVYIRMDYGVGVTHIINNYTWTQDKGNAGLAARNWTFAGSADGTTWTILDTNITGVWSGTVYENRSFRFTNTNAYRYYQMQNMSGAVLPTTTFGMVGLHFYYDAPPPPPIVSFTSNVTSPAYAPFLVQFNDTSVTTPTAWNWSYTNVTPGNNTQVWWSQIQNATQTFGIGNWNINLNVTNASGYNVSTAYYWVNVTTPGLTSNFTCSPLALTTSDTLSCVDSSAESGSTITNWSWTFEDAPPQHATTNNAAITYTSNGIWDVTLGVYNATTGWNNLTRPNYVTVSSSGALSGWNRQDIMMDQIYSLTLRIKDTSTHNGIPSAIIQLSTGDNTTTDLFGVATFSMNYSAVVVSVGATGYYSRTISYVVDRDRDETIYLTEVAATVTPNVPVINTAPKYITFHIKEGWGTPVTEVGVSIQGVSTSTGSWDWVATLLGVPLDEIPINGSAMYQTTDTFGKAVFYVLPTGKYNVSFTKTGYTFSPNPMILVPAEDDYEVWAVSIADPGHGTFYEHGYDELATVQISVTSATINETAKFVNISYNDILGHTTGGYIDVLTKSDTPFATDTLLVRWPAVSSSFTNSTIVMHIQQTSGQVRTNVTHSDFGTIRRSFPFTFNSVPVDFLGFSANIKLLIALGIMILTAMLGTTQSARQVSIAVCIEGWVFAAIHMFQALQDRGIAGEASMYLALVFMTLIAFLANVEVRKKKEKY